MSTDLLERPDVQDPGTDEPPVAHIVKKEDQMKGYFDGQEIEALCGYRWVPTMDYENKPVCEACKEALEKME